MLALGLLASLARADAPPTLGSKSIKTVTFKAGDGVPVTGDLYAPHGPGAPFILLFHQAGWSRGEYKEIAPKLNAIGYNALAIDQRSGRAVNSVQNQTHKAAAARELPTRHIDAYADMAAALDYALNQLKIDKVIVWGSSYSASLVFRLAAEHSKHVHAVLAFAPGEYFKKDESHDYVRSFAKRVRAPVFLTAAKAERPQAELIFGAVPGKTKTLYLPKTKGQHGSRALWGKWPDHAGYWTAVKAFLAKHAAP